MSVATTVTLEFNVISPEDMEVYVTAEPWPFMVGRPLHIIVSAYIKPVADQEDLIPAPNALVKIKENGTVIARGVTDQTGVFICDYTPEAEGTVTLTVEVASYEQA